MIHAVGVIEIKNIPKGVEACDDALKSAGVRLISAHPSCPGKYEILVTGSIAEVQTALEHVQDKYEHHVLDCTLMGRIDQAVIMALMGAQPVTEHKALGIIETYSGASIIKAADAAVKAANVAIVDLRLSRGMGGKGVVMLTGEVGDVTAAVEAGSDYAIRQGLFSSKSIMAAPHEELWEHL
ncbi:MAG: BMC domain-containing protein [Clostridia bacterium]|nr:BMC domain-containing protein [Clostridia bacterium]